MRNGIVITLIILSIVTIYITSHMNETPELYKTGSYEGIGIGQHGEIHVVVTTNAYKIEEIVIREEYEMPEIKKIVYDEIPKRVIRNNSADVQVIAGASYTSRGVIDAICEALEKAKKH